MANTLEKLKKYTNTFSNKVTTPTNTLDTLKSYRERTKLTQSKSSIYNPNWGEEFMPIYQDDTFLAKIGKGLLDYGVGSVVRAFEAPGEALAWISKNVVNLAEGKPIDKSRSKPIELLPNEAKAGLQKLSEKNPVIGTAVQAIISGAIDPATYVGGMGVLDDLARAGTVGKSATLGTTENLLMSAKSGQRALKGLPKPKTVLPTIDKEPLLPGQMMGGDVGIKVPKTMLPKLKSPGPKAGVEKARYLKSNKIKLDEGLLVGDVNNPIEIPKTTLPKMGKVSPRSGYEVARSVMPDVMKQQEVDDIIKSAQSWKDKPKLFLKRETMPRNFEDIMGADAPRMKKKFLDPITTNETKRVQFLKMERKAIKDLGIKPRSKESELLQKWGEGQINFYEMKAAAPDSWKKISHANKVLRQKYDSYLESINNVLTKNGYDPIPKREDYFKHFTEVSSVVERFGIPMKGNKLPTDINGLTSTFRPGKNFFSSALKRMTNVTDFDAITGIDKYLDGASKLIYHTDNIQRLRDLDKTLRAGFKGTDQLSNFVSELTEYTNLLAGKKAMIDRAAEDVVGRGIYGVVNRLKSQVASNMIGANISSALTNYIPLTQALATTDKPSFFRGMVETIANAFVKDGFVEKSGFLVRRIGSDPLSIKLWDKIAKKAGWLFQSVDNFTSQTIVRGKYHEGIKKGLSELDAIKYADDWAARIIADRSVGQVPTLFKSDTLGLLTQFQLEVNNQLSFIFKDIPRNFQGSSMASAIGQVFIYSFLFNSIYEKLAGRRPAIDPIGVIVDSYNDYTNPELSTGQATMNFTDRVLDQLPFTSTLTGGGRIPLPQAIPDVFGIVGGTADAGKEFMKPVTYLLPPTGGSQVAKTVKGVTALSKGGVTSQTEEGETLKYPVDANAGNIARGIAFGPSAFPETQEYYVNRRRPLSVSQTEKVRRSKNPEETYNRLMIERRIGTLEDKIKKAQKNDTLSAKAKKRRIEDLRKQIKRLREEL